MLILAAGLIVFLGMHSVRIVADDWRTRRIARIGEGAWKGIYSLISIAGFVLVVWGYQLTRESPVDLWHPPIWTRHVASLFTLVSFVLLAAAYVPRTRIKAAIGHPMVVGVKVWAFAHLLANGRLGDIVLFGAFFAWAVLDFSAAKRRDRFQGRTYPAAPGFSRDLIAVIIGIAGWAAFALHLHALLIGVRPFA